MASIIDSYREVFSDNLSFLKIAVFAFPVYYSHAVLIQSKQDLSWFYFVLGVTVFFLFGFLIETTSNVIREKDHILPSLNLFKVALSSIKGLLAIAPIALILGFSANYICSLIHIVPVFDIIFKSLIWIVIICITVTSFLLFTAKGRILDAYNFKILFQKAGDLIFVLIFFVLQLVIINIPITGFMFYTLLILFGHGTVMNMFLAFILVFNIAVTGHYLGQIHYEAITYGENFK